MGIGNFRHRAVFSSRSSDTDDFGQPSLTYNPQVTVGVEISQLTGNERQTYQNGVAISENFIAVRARWSQTLDTFDEDGRVAVNGRTYDIVGFDRLNDRRQYIRFILRELR